MDLSKIFNKEVKRKALIGAGIAVAADVFLLGFGTLGFLAITGGAGYGAFSEIKKQSGGPKL